MWRRRAMIISGSVLTMAGGCRTTGNTGADQGSHLRVYEGAEYDSINVCQLIRDEAVREASRVGAINVFASYRNILAREKAIFTGLVESIENCRSLSQAPRTASGESGPSCRDHDAERLPVYQRRLTEMTSCPELSASGLPEAVARNAVSKACAQLGSSLPNWLNDDCTVSEQALRNAGSSALRSSCNFVTELVKDRLDQDARDSVLVQCTSREFKETCSRIGAALGNQAQARLSGDTAAVEQAERDIKNAESFAWENLRQFAGSTGMCIQGHALSALKVSAANYLSSTAFEIVFRNWLSQGQEALTKQSGSIKAAAIETIAVAACRAATNQAADRIGKTPQKVHQDQCSPEALRVDRHQIAQCLRTIGDVCEISSGSMDLEPFLGSKTESELLELSRGIAEGGLEALCTSGGKVSSVACSTISKSAGYIKDAFKGESNPWADCAGTPKIGACIGQKWYEWSSGIRTADLAVGVDQERTDQGIRSKKMCLCWRNCFKDYSWPRSNELYRSERAFFPGHPGAAGVRLCESNERTHKNKGIHEGVSVLYTYTDCEITETRQRGTDAYLAPGSTLEYLKSGSWRSLTVPQEWNGCI